MKQKLFYLVVVIVALGTFASAKQVTNTGYKKVNEIREKPRQQSPVTGNDNTGVGIELSPLKNLLLAL